MQDLAVEPYVKFWSGTQWLYRFKNGQKVYNEKEFKDLLRKSIKEGMSGEAVKETTPVNSKNNRKKST